jgi:hypothetical protein
MRVSKKVILVPVVLAVGVWAGYPAVRCYQHDHYLIDGKASCVLPILFREDTEYAPGYSTGAFRSLRVGMTKDDALGLLRPPLSKYPVEGAEEGWRWTGSPGDRSHRVRVVIFTGGRVSKIDHEFYID